MLLGASVLSKALIAIRFDALVTLFSHVKAVTPPSDHLPAMALQRSAHFAGACFRIKVAVVIGHG